MLTASLRLAPDAHRVSGSSAAQQDEAAVVFLAATLCLAQLLRALVVGQVEHFLSFAIIFQLQTQLRPPNQLKHEWEKLHAELTG